MARRLAAARLIVASHNAGKVREIAALLSPLGIEAVGAAALGLAEPEETGETFVANAALKARAAATASGEPALADDSGLVVPALDGAPGIYSARWAGPGKDFRIAMDRIEAELAARGSEPVGAAAYFVCALSLGWPDGHCETVEGRVDGALTFPPRGPHGFGYDPIFVPDGHARTFGEMPPEEKQPLTHRARAFEQLVAVLRLGQQ
ncbi:MAG: RdgB/HAM1 family non-canonical purine NTP pyrophosphatase [Rhodospirillales bacterium]|nr:RdgB/HAM1 family non-canonical purine NTP pyrophosphatase [Rhodospirillales bacterium]